MGRSKKKGPYVDLSVLEKVKDQDGLLGLLGLLGLSGFGLFGLSGLLGLFGFSGFLGGSSGAVYFRQGHVLGGSV